MTTERNIIIHAGQTFTLSLDYAGTAGRGQRMHIRASDAAADVIAILSHNGDANARVIYDGTDSLDITIGASVNGGWLVGANRVEWVYDIEDYDLSDADDVVITHRGRVIVYGNRTRADDVTPSAAMPSGDGRYVRFDGVQGLTEEQQQQARDNIGVTGGGGGSSAWGGITGTLSDQADLQAALDAKAPLASPALTGTPAAPTAAGGTSTTQIATTAFVGAAVSTHAGAADPHGDRAYTDTQIAGRQAASATLTTLSSATAAGLALMDDATAADQRTTLGLGTAATAATGDFAAASHTHAASDVTSGTFDPARLPAATDTAQGAVELATTAEALTGTDTTRAVTAAGVKAVADTKAASSHTHAASDITSGTLDAARLPAPGTTTLGGVKRNTGSAGQFVTGIDTDGSLLRDTPAGGSPAGSDTQVLFNDGGAIAGDSALTFDKTTDVLTCKVYQAQKVNNAPLLQTGTTSADAALIWVTGNELQAARGDIGALISFQASVLKASTQFQSGSYAMGVYNSGMAFGNTNFTAFANATCHTLYVCGATGGYDTALTRDAANTLAQRNSTNAQTMRVYGTFTDLSNRVNAALSATSTTVTLAAETAGTGADNVPVNINAAGTSPVSFGSPAQAKSYTVATAPSASASGAGAIIYVTDESGGAVLAFSDATDWRRVTDRAVIS